jgi:hypothetical protein
VLVRTVLGVNAQQTLAFHQLLSVWNRREDARSAGDLPALSTARAQLDEQRMHMRNTLTGIR